MVKALKPLDRNFDSGKGKGKCGIGDEYTDDTTMMDSLSNMRTRRITKRIKSIQVGIKKTLPSGRQEYEYSSVAEIDMSDTSKRYVITSDNILIENL